MALGYVSIGGGSVSFVENIQIKESGRPRLAEYRVIGKPHTVYGLLGSESRNVTVSFNLTHRDNAGGLLRSIRKSTFASGGGSLPTVRVSYSGFSNIKGICKNYSISIDEQAGYSSGGHANRYKVTMMISETQKPSL